MLDAPIHVSRITAAIDLFLSAEFHFSGLIYPLSDAHAIHRRHLIHRVLLQAMPSAPRSSRRRYLDYRAKLKQRRARQQGEISPASLGTHGATSNVGADSEEKKKRRSRSALTLFRQFWTLLGEHRLTIIIAMIGASIATMFSVLPLYGTKIVFDYVLNNHPLPRHVPQWIVDHRPGPQGILLWVAAAMVFLTAASELISLAARWQATRVTKRMQVGMKKLVFEHAVRLPLHRVYELKSGGVTSILREDASSIADLIFSMMINPTRAITQLLFSLMVLAFVDWKLLLGALALLPTVWLTHRTWIARIRPLFRDIRSTRQHVDAHATEAFGGMRVVRSFSRQRYETGSFSTNNALMARQEIFAWWWMRGIDVAWSILIPLASALLLYFGGMRVLSDMHRVEQGLITQQQALSVGDLVMFLAYLGALLGPIAMLAGSASALQTSLAGLDRVLDLLHEPREMPSKTGAITINPDRVQAHITLDRVSFSYPGSGGNILEDISLDVQPGEMIALVGPSGAGKTTLCNLVARFYDPTAGSIKIDGTDLRDITIESYRQLLGIVEQDTFLFDGTIAENIAYGRRGASMDEIIAAAKSASAHEFISSFSEGYDSVIGERGVKLSGGQRQRLTIARAILADPRILILDEATSNLDTESERLIQSSLHALMTGRTSFVIAHRLSTIAHADRIVVLEKGKIVEMGRHDELMRASGRYREMVELQVSPPPSPVRNTPTEDTPASDNLDTALRNA